MDIKKTYNFNTLASTILGASYKNMKVEMTMTAKQAVKVVEGGVDIYTKHKTLRNTITGLPVNADDCTFLLLKNTITNEPLVIAIEYIDLNSVVEVNTVTAHFTVNNIDTQTVSIVSNMLKEIGITDFEITTS